jgi:basic membrane protein A and related proteins
MRKSIALAIVLALLVSAAPASGDAEDTYTKGAYTYTLLDGNAAITAYTGTDKELTLPEKLDGHPVVKIEDNAFKNCGSLASLIIPEGVAAIGRTAFAECLKLKSVTIAKSVIAIGPGAFVNTALGKITLKKGNPIYELKDGVLFDRDQSMLHTYPCGNTAEEYRISDGTLRIEEYAFFANSHIKRIVVPDGLRNIRESAFSGCSSLSSINIPASVTGIGNWAFNGTKLSLIDVAETNPVYSMKDGALFDREQKLLHTYLRANGVSRYEIPPGTLVIGTGAFADCTNLAEIVIPDGVAAIGSLAFSHCSSLESVTVPGSVTAIAADAFKYCDKLTLVVTAGSLAIGYARDNGLPYRASGANAFGKEPGELGIAIIINGTLRNNSLGDLYYSGLMQAADTFGFHAASFIFRGDSIDYGPFVSALAASSQWDLILAGNESLMAIQVAAKANPGKKFILCDARDDLSLTNIYSVEYRTNEGSFIAGAAAALITASDAPFANKDKVIGFIGGGDYPFINDFLVGFINGAQAVEPDIKVAVGYTGSWQDAEAGRRIAADQINRGADVLFAVAGGAGMGVFYACKELGAYAIGVDVDQALEMESVNPELSPYICTSMQKKADVLAQKAISGAIAGTLPWGTHQSVGLAEGCIGVAQNRYSEAILTRRYLDALADLTERVRAGELAVGSFFAMSRQDYDALITSVSP